MKIIIPAYSKTYWCLEPFAYLFNKYWKNQDPVILYYSELDVKIPKNFSTFQIYYKDYPKDKWANGIIEYLKTINDETIILLLEDYWLTRKVSSEIISILNALAEKDKNISEDESKTAQDSVQKMTDKYVSQADEICALKEKEVMEI